MHSPLGCIYIPARMVTTEERPHMFFDIDHTLVRPITEDEEADVYINGMGFIQNSDLLYELEISKARGHIIVLWSQGGSRWAADVAHALKITNLVDICMAKPSWYADDKLSEEILDPTRRFYREF